MMSLVCGSRGCEWVGTTTEDRALPDHTVNSKVIMIMFWITSMSVVTYDVRVPYNCNVMQQIIMTCNCFIY